MNSACGSSPETSHHRRSRGSTDRETRKHPRRLRHCRGSRDRHALWRHAGRERQRRSICQPRVGGPAAYPGKNVPRNTYPNGVASPVEATPLGLKPFFHCPRVGAPASHQPWANTLSTVGWPEVRGMAGTPKAFHHSAQGWREERVPTLGINLRVRQTLNGFHLHGGRCAATLSGLARLGGGNPG